MGSYLDIHVGPYMLVAKVATKRDVVKLVCVNSDCIKFDQKSDAPFCSQCGHKSEHKTFIETSYKNVHDILNTDDFEDEMYLANDGSDLLEIGWFMDEYDKIISAIENEFGKENVQIKWGIIKHYN